MKKFLSLFLLMIITTIANAQEAEMADVMRSNGKIYVVVGIILIILIGLITYLFMLDRKITKLENKLTDKR
jgi:multisubunit Na+/H+ antiporter MnhB subunit